MIKKNYIKIKVLESLISLSSMFIIVHNKIKQYNSICSKTETLGIKLYGSFLCFSILALH